MKLFPAFKLSLLNINFVLGYPSFTFFSYILTENNIPYRNDCFKIQITKQIYLSVFPFCSYPKMFG